MSRRRTSVALTAWVALLAVAVVWGHELLPGGRLNVMAPPFQGLYRLLLLPLLPAVAYAVVIVLAWPLVAPRLGWPTLLLTSWLLTAGWAVLLSASEGTRRLWSPITRPHEYVAALPAVGNHPLGWLSGFTENFGQHPLHVRGHPPLFVLTLWAWDQLGPTREPWAATLVIAVGASITAAVAICVRELACEQTARAALPFLVLAPTAVTVATSADAFFGGVGAWGVALLTLGVARRSLPAAFIAGVLLGALPFLSYGLLPFGAVPLVVVLLVHRGNARLVPGRAVATAMAVLVGLAVVPMLMTAGGFWWPDGVAATHRAWVAGRGDERPYAYSFVADLALLAVLVGPATAVAATRTRRGPAAALATAAGVGVLLLAVSGVTRLEVERIWLPFAPWLLVLCSALRGDRRWLALNATTAVAWQALVYDVW